MQQRLANKGERRRRTTSTTTTVTVVVTEQNATATASKSTKNVYGMASSKDEMQKNATNDDDTVGERQHEPKRKEEIPDSSHR